MDAETLARAILTPDAPLEFGPYDGGWTDGDRIWVYDFKADRLALGEHVHGRGGYHTTLPDVFSDAAMVLARTVTDGRRRHGLIKHLRDERRHVERMYR